MVPNQRFPNKLRATYFLLLICLPVLNRSYAIEEIKDPHVAKSLQRLASVSGTRLAQMPHTMFLTVKDSETDELGMYSLIRNNGHSNVSHLLSESPQLLPEEDMLTVTRGFVGAYPNAFCHVKKSELAEFVEAIANLKSDNDYRILLNRFGIRRTDPGFWQYSDDLHSAYKNRNSIEAGLFDYNRLENR